MSAPAEDTDDGALLPAPMTAVAVWKDLCIDVAATQVAEAAIFWGRTLGLRTRAHPSREGVVALEAEDPRRTLWINVVPEVAAGKNRVHLDLWADRLASSSPHDNGIKSVDHEPDDAAGEWAVLTDPAGAALCAFPRRSPTTRFVNDEALVVDAQDPVAQAAWWADVLGARVTPGPDGGLRWLRDVPGLPWAVWKFVAVPEPKTTKNRWHWDLEATSGAATSQDGVARAVELLLARGAHVLRRPDAEASWHVLADPEGNEFCLFEGPAVPRPPESL